MSTPANEPPAAQQGAPLLEVRDLIVHHGQLRALSGISLRVFPGESAPKAEPRTTGRSSPGKLYLVICG